MLEEILEAAEPAQARKAKGKHPEGWEPSVEFKGETGTLVTRPTTKGGDTGSGIDWDDEFAHWGLDPAEWEIIEPIQFRFWDAAIGEGQTKMMRYFKASFRRSRPHLGELDVQALISEIKRHKVRRKPVFPDLEAPVPPVLMAVWADLQLGKGDGDGVEGTVARALAAIDGVVRRRAELAHQGIVIDTLYTPSLGDIIEGCSGHYAQQAFRTKLNLRDQIKLARRIFVKATTEWARHFDTVIVPVVAGNHGENRNIDSGKSYTDFADNFDVALWEQVEEIVHASDQYDHVKFVIPNHRLDMTLDIAGTIVTFAHGHQFSRGADPAKKALEWWRGQMEGQQPAGDSDLLMSGHFHHLQVVTRGQRTWIEAPALEGGSEWWVNQTGLASPPGMLTLTVGAGAWDNLRVLT